MLDTSLFSYCVWGKPPITIIMMMTGTMMMMMTISPFVAASVWVITVLFHCVCVCARVRDVDVCWMSVEMGWILLAVFFYIHCVLAFFFCFPRQTLSIALTAASSPCPQFFSTHFFFAFYLRRKPPFFMRANYAALSIPLPVSRPLPRWPPLSFAPSHCEFAH